MANDGKQDGNFTSFGLKDFLTSKAIIAATKNYDNLHYVASDEDFLLQPIRDSFCSPLPRDEQRL